jgi:hypothetical protein
MIRRLAILLDFLVASYIFISQRSKLVIFMIPKTTVLSPVLGK